MKQLETTKNCIRLNLLLAKRYMQKKDFELAMYRIQDARHLLEELNTFIRKTKQKSP